MMNKYIFNIMILPNFTNTSKINKTRKSQSSGKPDCFVINVTGSNHFIQFPPKS